MDNIENIKTIYDLAYSINIKEMLLRKYLNKQNIADCYHSFNIPKKDGTHREILAPDKNLKEIQKRINALLSRYYNINLKEKNQIPHAFIKGRSIISNAKIHRHKKIVLCMDIRNFFDTINFGRVLGYLRKNKYLLLTKEVSFAIAKIACCNNKLPQGSPLSPVLSNLIAGNVDYYVAHVSKKYRCDYTRYADDMTFSTNDIKFKDKIDRFIIEICDCVLKSGFDINMDKTHVMFNNSCQKVTGLVINNKIGVKRNYWKKARAMCHKYFKIGEFFTSKGMGKSEELLGRLSFINQIDKYNNKLLKKQRKVFNLNVREKIYRDYIFFEKLYNNKKPVIVTEGKTDILYLRAAILKSKLVSSEFGRNNGYMFDFDTLNVTKSMSYLLGITRDGGSKMSGVYRLFKDKDSLNLEKTFDDRKYIKSNNPIILLLDNEKSKDKPLSQFKNLMNNKLKDNEINENNFVKLDTNGKPVFLLTLPRLSSGDCEIEDLFDKEVLEIEIGGRKFSRDDEDKNKYYNKDIFSRYIFNNYKKINFSKFKETLDTLEKIISLCANNN